MKVFNLDLHISPIRDIQWVCKELYGNNVEITSWSISGHKDLLDTPSPNVDIINQDTWKNIDETMIEEFNKKYESVLVEYDAFIVTHTPVFALIFARYNKPIIIHNTCRYDQPYCFFNKPNRLDELLKEMVDKNQATIISNNMNDYQYLLKGTGIESHIIPSLCMYVNATHQPFELRQEAVCFGDRNLFPEGNWLVEKPVNYTYTELFKYKAIVHVPYEMSTMSIFE